MCSKSQSECQNPDIIKDGFLIDRDTESIRDLAIALTDPITGEVVRKKVTTALDRVSVIFQ